MTQPALFATPDSDMAPVTEGAVIDTQSTEYKGKVSEAAFAYQAVLRGWDVFDAGGAPDMDKILKRPNTLPLAVQVKRAYFDAPRKLYIVNCSRTRRCDNTRILYSTTAFDILAVHLHDADRWVFYTRAELGNRTRTSYTLPSERKNKTSRNAPDARDPDNWSLIDAVASSKIISQA